MLQCYFLSFFILLFSSSVAFLSSLYTLAVFCFAARGIETITRDATQIPFFVDFPLGFDQ